MESATYPMNNRGQIYGEDFFVFSAPWQKGKPTEQKRVEDQESSSKIKKLVLVFLPIIILAFIPQTKNSGISAVEKELRISPSYRR